MVQQLFVVVVMFFFRERQPSSVFFFQQQEIDNFRNRFCNAISKTTVSSSYLLYVFLNNRSIWKAKASVVKMKLVSFVQLYYVSSFVGSAFQPSSLHLRVPVFTLKGARPFAALKSTATATAPAAPEVSSSPTISLRTSKRWENRFEELVFFYSQHGHCNVPRNSGPLGNWVQKQRLSYKLYNAIASESASTSTDLKPTKISYSSPPNPLGEEQVQLLDSIGFIWDVHEYKYQCNLNELKEFFIRNSHIDVPSSLDGEYRSLYKWLCRQKEEYRKYLYGEDSKLSYRRREALETLGFHIGMFDVCASTQVTKRISWEGRYEQLLKFRKDHGGQCNVPGNEEKFNQLSSWIQHQRAEKRKKDAGKKSRLSDEKESLLENVGFIWSTKEWKWSLRLEELRKYKEAHGHCNVPTKEAELGGWVMTQRLQYGNEKISKERIEKLNELGFIWNMHSLAWDEKYNELRDHLEEEGRYASTSLMAWIATQRAEKRYKDLGLQNHLTDDRERKLKEIGFDWNVNECREQQRQINWARNFEKLQAHFEENGSAKFRIKSGNDDSFYVWVRDQRRYLKAFENGLDSPMTKERRDLLVSIGL